ncbi:2-C-methyl-D-erythritol 4-phosphate cytidylyltransferase [Succinimonas amylolytica]|uniref:2-C-methyl-D-erythritol 4-phosphate cytidylyltransferase n=1 Tax=Succinimonas amylolytica TaxID=83769 RepID=UPI0003743246|nr:2-C-methyl-D-erythritol 4-phosphate cytidylyltransferase [Succinimonas amylolytica]
MTALIDIVIPAAGIGKRMQAALPKQYLSFASSTILEETLKRVLRFSRLGRIILVLNPEDQYFRKTSLAGNDRIVTVSGGAERGDSVLSGIRAATTEYVMVHDAARPCIMMADLERLSYDASTDNGGVLAVKIPDTVKRGDDRNVITATVSRTGLWRALTPQMFKRKLLIAAYEKAMADGQVLTDEASAMEYVGYHPLLVPGSSLNIKITEPQDLALGELFFREMD